MSTREEIEAALDALPPTSYILLTSPEKERIGTQVAAMRVIRGWRPAQGGHDE